MLENLPAFVSRIELEPSLHDLAEPREIHRARTEPGFDSSVPERDGAVKRPTAPRADQDPDALVAVTARWSGSQGPRRRRQAPRCGAYDERPPTANIATAPACQSTGVKSAGQLSRRRRHSQSWVRPLFALLSASALACASDSRVRLAVRTRPHAKLCLS